MKRHLQDSAEDERPNKKAKGQTQHKEIFGSEAKPSIELALQDYVFGKRKKLMLSDVQHLILYTTTGFDFITQPKWIKVHHRALIDKVVVVVINSLNTPVYNQHKNIMPALSKVASHVCPLQAPWNKFQESYTLMEKPKNNAQFWKNSLTLNLLRRKILQKKNKDFSSVASTLEMINEEPEPTRKPKIIEIIFEEKFNREEFLLKEEVLEANEYPINEETFIQVKVRPEGHTGKPKELMSMDCEMCITEDGFSVARITLLNEEGETLYDQFVKPDKPILDYNTRYSGITEKHLESVTKTLVDAQNDLQEFIFQDTILVGHSLENDLRSLKMIHKRVIDTSIAYGDGTHYKKSLRTLAWMHLSRAIQEGSSGHDSVEDALAALDLVKMKLMNGHEFGVKLVQAPTSESIFSIMHKYDKKCSLVDIPSVLQKITAGTADASPGMGDDEILSKASSAVKNKNNDFVWVQFHELESFYAEPKEETLEQVLKKTNDRIEALNAILPPSTMMLIIGGFGNLTEIEKLTNELSTAVDVIHKKKELTDKIVIASDALFLCGMN
jgi:RNA exonuclease 1